MKTLDATRSSTVCSEKDRELRKFKALSLYKVTTTGAWSLGRSFLRGNLSIAQAVTDALKALLTKIWSIRKPLFFLKPKSR
jgi:hypothetical protein